MFLSAFFITNASLLFLHQLLYRAAQLVGARCGLAVAAYSLEACNHVLVFHSLNQACDALQVAVASAIEFHVCENTVLARYLNVSRTGSVCGVCYCLHGVLVDIGDKVPKDSKDSKDFMDFNDLFYKCLFAINDVDTLAWVLYLAAL